MSESDEDELLDRQPHTSPTRENSVEMQEGDEDGKEAEDKQNGGATDDEY